MKRVFLLVGLLLGQGAQVSAQTPYYQGKTITFIVGSGAGTAYDIYSRLLANHIGKHIPGNPTVIMQNMPAAGGIVAANYVYAVAKPDGLTIASINPAHYFNQLQGNKEIKFDWTKFTRLERREGQSAAADHRYGLGLGIGKSVDRQADGRANPQIAERMAHQGE